MRTAVILAASFLALYLPVAAAEVVGDADAGAAKAVGCKGCHNSVVNLNGRGADTIAAQTKAIRSGAKQHPPGVTDLSDDDIADIAAYLDGA
jgi:cytochrome c553